MPLGRRFAAISIALITAAAGLIATPTAQAATVTLTALDCQADSSATTTLASTISTSDVVSLTFDGCNGATFTWSANFTGTVNGGSESSPYSRNGSNRATLDLTATSGPSAGATILTVAFGSKTFTYKQPTPPWTAASPPNGVIGSAYGSGGTGYQFNSGIAGATYSVASGSLPGGLALSGDTLGGTPTQIGDFTFELSATDGTTTSTSGDLTISVTGSVIDKVTICHRTRATTNPYVVITVSVNSVIGSGGRNGHQDHNTTRTNSTNPTTNGITPGSGPFDTSFSYPSNRKWWGDIIPPFTYSGGTFAGLNWSSDWNYPDPTSGTSSWLEDDEFAAAIRDAAGVSTTSVYYKAAEQCLDLSAGTQSTASAEMDTPQKYFNVSVRNGEDPDSIKDDLDDQQAEAMGGGTPGGSPISIPTTSSLETTYTSTAGVTTDAATGVGRTSATLNGTLKSGTTWTSWKFEWATAPEDVAGSSDNYTSTSIPSANNAGDREVDREITGLTCATQYYYRVIGNGTEVGLIKTFTTSSCPGNSGGGGSNSGGGNSGGGNGNSGGNSGNNSGSGTTTPPAQTPTIGGGRPSRLTLPPAGPANRPVTPGNSTAPGNSSTPGNSNSDAPGGGGDDDTTSGSTGTSTPGSPTNPLTTVYRPRNLTPTTSVPAPPGTEWEPTQTRIQDPATGQPVLRVTTEAGTWEVDERSGAITYSPSTGFAGSATVNVVLVARSGEIYIHPMRVPIAFTSRVKVLSGDVPRDISGGAARIIRPWHR